MGVALASYENPAYTGPHSLSRTTMTGALRELKAETARYHVIEGLKSQTVAGGGDGTLDLRHFPNNQGTQPLRTWSRPAWLASIQARQQAIIAAAKYQQVQQD